MILQALVQEYENLAAEGKAAEEGWCLAKVSCALHISEQGELLGVISLKEEVERGNKKIWVPQWVNVPEMVTRSSGISANFLCDKSKYMLGIDENGANAETLERFEAAKNKHLEVLQNAEGEVAKAVCFFFQNWNPETAAEQDAIKEHWEELTEGGNLIFFLKGKYAQDDAYIKKAWEDALERIQEESEPGICLVTGQKTYISRIHKNIKGIPGAQSSGAALVSFNAPAFESYGKEQSYNAPVGRYAEFAYTTALNYLLNQREHLFQLGDSMVVFWAENGAEEYQDTFFMLANPRSDNEQELHGIFDNLRKQRPVEVNGIQLNPEQKFYILCLAPNAARLSVRFFYQNSFGKILENLSKHYERLKIVQPSWETREYMGVRDMLLATANEKAKDKAPVSNMAAMVLLAILGGTRYPASLYTDVLIRIRAGQGEVTSSRAAIIKAYLIQNFQWEKGENYMALNEESKDTAYLLGRLFSVLESVQRDANPGINATIRDRYFNSACIMPASVFPILFRLKNSHMKKLERERPGAKFYYEECITQIMGNLQEFPKRMTLEDQGKFDLGYYHQVQKRYEKKEEK